MRIQTALRRYAYKRYLATLFSHWRKVITWKSFKNKNTKRRAFKNLKCFYQYRKNIMSLTTAVLMNRKETNKHNVVMAFGALRRNKAQEKL